MAATALIVEFHLKPGSRAAFDVVMLDHAKKTRAEEPGCRQFDVFYPDGDDDRVLLFEVYADQAAYETHRQGPRMPGVNAALGELITSRTITVGSLA